MLSPEQILESMLECVVSFDGAHSEDTLDRAILKAEANILFRMLRVIEESSGQRFAVTASGKYLDLIGNGKRIPRYAGESDESYRTRLIFSDAYWNDVTLTGIKNMIKNYYGIDVDGDEYDETRVVELYKQAACFFSEEEADQIEPWGEFGAEWLGANTQPGSFEVHLKCFQDGEERFIKKREVKNKLMAVRAAGIVVMLYFHLSFEPDVMKPLEGAIDEIELISSEDMPVLDLMDKEFEVTVTNNEVTNIMASAEDEVTGLVSKRIVHMEQRNKCRPDYVPEESFESNDPVEIARYNRLKGSRRPEPFRLRQSLLRNQCWSLYYGVKYEEMDITKASYTYSLAWNQPGNFVPQKYKIYYRTNPNDSNYLGVKLKWYKNRVDSPFIVDSSELVDVDNPSIFLRNVSMAASYEFKIMAIADDGTEVGPVDSAYATYDEGTHTYYTRPNPMEDIVHHYRGEDLYSYEFYSIVDYYDFWWRVSTVKNGVIHSRSVPWKLSVYNPKEEKSTFWWKVSTVNGQEVSVPTKAAMIEIMGKSKSPLVATRNIMDIRDWAIQTKNIDLGQIYNSAKDLVVLERFNNDYEYWRRFDLISLRVAEMPSRYVTSRLPVFAFPNGDPFLATLASSLKGIPSGNYTPVKFWEEEFQDKYWYLLDKILRSGFSGVLLDGLWAFNDIETGKFGEAAVFIQEIMNYFRKIRSQPNFVFGLRNVGIWNTVPEIVQNINFVVAENLFYAGDVLQPSAYTGDLINSLNMFYQNATAVFVLDYVVDVNIRALFIQKCKALGFVPYVTNSSWDSL